MNSKEISGYVSTLKDTAMVMSLLTGSSSLEELRKKAIESAYVDISEVPSYEELDEEDKKGCDEVVATFQSLQKFCDEAIKAKATMNYKYFRALVIAGFTTDQAIQIAAAQSVEMK